MNEDAELGAMSAVVQALTPLDEQARKRVLQYAQARFKTAEIENEITDTPEEEHADSNTAGARAQLTEFGSLAELYHGAQPSTDSEKALVASVWFQVCEAREGLDSFTVNSALKNLGYPVGNITRAVDALMTQRPALMMQLRKSGTSKQARKLYKVTDAGIKKAEDLVKTSAQMSS
jgi:hypothetical protein